MDFSPILEKKAVKASVPCRIDFGGTLDISTFYLSMQEHKPSSINIALDMRTHVSLIPYTPGRIKVSSKGFEAAEFEQGRAPFNHPMGLMFCTANYFNAHGVHIHIESESPPKSAMGGSSCASAAIISAFLKVLDKPIDPTAIAWLAHYLEASVAGVPCGMQDQLAAVYGGVNQWTWEMGAKAPVFKQDPIFTTPDEIARLNQHIKVAYCGIPHVSKDINNRWVHSFISGESRSAFRKISQLTRAFGKALKNYDFKTAADLMNQETRIRCELTPDVLDPTGQKLFEAAQANGCGTRFSGAGGGGSVWAIGEQRDIEKLDSIWHNILDSVKNAKILNTKIENEGIIVV